MAVAIFGRQILDRFTYDLEIEEDSIESHLVREDFIAFQTCGVPGDLGAALLDVFEK